MSACQGSRYTAMEPDTVRDRGRDRDRDGDRTEDGEQKTAVTSGVI